MIVEKMISYRDRFIMRYNEIIAAVSPETNLIVMSLVGGQHLRTDVQQCSHLTGQETIARSRVTGRLNIEVLAGD